MKKKLAVGLAAMALAVVSGSASAQTQSENVLVYRKADIAIAPEVWRRIPQVEVCTSGDSCDDHDDCTDDFCDFKEGHFQTEPVRGVCRHESNDHCGGPALYRYKVMPVDVPLPPPAVENPPAAEPEPLPVPETPTIPGERPQPAKEPPPEPASSFALKFDCGAADEDTISVDGRDVIFPIDAEGKRTQVTLKATPQANGTPVALAAAISGVEKIELSQTGGSELVLLKSSDEDAEASSVSEALVVDASGEPGLVPTDFSFQAPIPVAPDRGGVEIYTFTAKLVDAEGRTLATAAADCRIGLQVKGGGGLGGCSLVDGEFETQQVFGLFGIFAVAWCALLLAEKFGRSRKN